MKICICDDDRAIHDELRERMAPFFSESDSPEIVDCYSGEEIVDLTRAESFFDIVFLDVEIGRINGIEAAGEIKSLAPDTIIVFVSNHKSYVFDAFRCEALHYIVKPIRTVEFDDVFNRAIHKYTAINRHFPIQWKHTRTNLKISEITYIEAFRRKLVIHTACGKEYEHIGKMPDAFEILKPHGFAYVHQGYIVNLAYVQTVSAEHCVMESGEKIMISTRRRAETLSLFNKYIQKWKW